MDRRNHSQFAPSKTPKVGKSRRWMTICVSFFEADVFLNVMYCMLVFGLHEGDIVAGYLPSSPSTFSGDDE